MAGTAGHLGLSKEMGALIAGMVIAAFPYGVEVIARLSGVRDFFVTLFFVALGMKLVAPSPRVLALTAGLAAFVIVSRFVTVFPVFRLLRLDLRTAGVVGLNLGQVSEFSLVIVTLGAGYGHVSRPLVDLVLYALLATAVLSTKPSILFNHELASVLGRALAVLGLSHWGRPPQAPQVPHAHDIFLLGVSREGLALLRHLDREHPGMKQRIVAVDFNRETLEALTAQGVACHYGDLANADTLRHAGIEGASVVVSSISDWFLKGTDNRRLLRQVRGLAPSARVVVTADSPAGARRLYAEGADYVLMPPALAAEHLYHLLLDGGEDALAKARDAQADILRQG